METTKGLHQYKQDLAIREAALMKELYKSTEVPPYLLATSYDSSLAGSAEL